LTNSAAITNAAVNKQNKNTDNFFMIFFPDSI